MTPAEIIETSVNIIRGVLSFAEAFGQKDAVIAALDGVLAAARGKTDQDLAAKHRAE